MRKIEVRAAIRALAEVKKGGLNPIPGRERPAFSRTATVKDRRRPSRIVPDRHNRAGTDELSTERPLPFMAELATPRFGDGREQTIRVLEVRGRGLGTR
jgi:hypothetical protein